MLKVAHHGAKEGTSLGFLEALTPQLAVEAGNRFRHPSADVLARLEEAGGQVWTTDECGDVEIVADGKRLWVRVARTSPARSRP